MAISADWNIRMVNAREARELLPKGTDGQSIDWGKVRVAHLDTGYTRHPIFGDWDHGGAWLDVADGLNSREGGSDALDPLDYEGNPGHGTRTASVLCGINNDPATGSEIGIAPRLPLVPCRIVDRVVLTPETQRERVAEGIRHAIDKRCAVISMSLGTPFFWPGTTGGMGRAVDRAYNRGIIMVGAAGQFIDRVTYPGKYDRTICAGGVTWQRRVWWEYSDGRDMVDVWAPAAEVLRANPGKAQSPMAVDPIEGDDPGSSAFGSLSNSGSITKGEGTSYATVHVAAAAAMWIRHHGKELDRAYPKKWQRVEAFRGLLADTASSLHAADNGNGKGILDILALLRAPLPPASELTKAGRDKKKFG